eukprot:COSAG04_NODE_6348_length_1350_cov_1.872102_1_plen_92_part_10
MKRLRKATKAATCTCSSVVPHLTSTDTHQACTRSSLRLFLTRKSLPKRLQLLLPGAPQVALRGDPSGRGHILEAPCTARVLPDPPTGWRPLL